MGTVGQVILTVRGSYALADAQATGKSIKPQYYKVSNQDIQLDPTLTDISGVWKQDNISGYIPIDNDTVEFIIDIPPEQAISYGRTFGLYLTDGTLFAIAKPPYPFPPNLRQTFKVQIKYSNINQITDFQYVPFYETEQSITTMDVSSSLGIMILETVQTLSVLQGDYRQFKGYVNSKTNDHEERISISEKDISQLQLVLLDQTLTLGEQMLKSSQEVEYLKSQIFVRR